MSNINREFIFHAFYSLLDFRKWPYFDASNIDMSVVHLKGNTNLLLCCAIVFIILYETQSIVFK